MIRTKNMQIMVTTRESVGNKDLSGGFNKNQYRIGN